MTFDIKRLKGHRIYIDTCSLMHPPAWRHISDVLMPELKASGMMVTVPLRVLSELRKLQDKEGETGLRASVALKAVAAMLEAGVLEFSGADEEGAFADNYFLYTFTRLRLESDLALITQDRDLALDLHNLSRHRSVKGQKRIVPLRFGDQGLSEWEFGGGNGKNGPQQPRRSQAAEVKKLIASLPEGALYSPKYGRVTLEKKLLETPAGALYSTDGGFTCKLYAPGKAAQWKGRLAKMLDTPLSSLAVCWPLDEVLDRTGTVGYLAGPAPGVPLKDAVFRGRLTDSYPHWTRRTLVQLALDVASAVEALHGTGVVLGGLNPGCIIVNSAGRAKVVNADEFQVGGFSALCVDRDFLPHDVAGKPGLMEPWQDCYGLAVLIFMVLLPGKHPFSPGAGTGCGRLRLVKFPYPFGEVGGCYTPGPPWNHIWSHLSYRIKELFHCVFRKEKRVSPQEWAEALRAYLRLIETGRATDEVYPSGYKIADPVEVVCVRCGAEDVKERAWVESLALKGVGYLCENCLEEPARERGGDNGN